MGTEPPVTEEKRLAERQVVIKILNRCSSEGTLFIDTQTSNKIISLMADALRAAYLQGAEDMRGRAKAAADPGEYEEPTLGGDDRYDGEYNEALRIGNLIAALPLLPDGDAPTPSPESTGDAASLL